MIIGWFLLINFLSWFNDVFVLFIIWELYCLRNGVKVLGNIVWWWLNLINKGWLI